MFVPAVWPPTPAEVCGAMADPTCSCISAAQAAALDRLAALGERAFPLLHVPVHVDDWLGQYREWSQSVTELSKFTERAVATAKSHRIYVQPIRAHDTDPKDFPSLDVIREYIECFFGLEPGAVGLLDAMVISETHSGQTAMLNKKRIHFRTKSPASTRPLAARQFNADDMIDVLLPIKVSMFC